MCHFERSTGLDQLIWPTTRTASGAKASEWDKRSQSVNYLQPRWAGRKWYCILRIWWCHTTSKVCKTKQQAMTALTYDSEIGWDWHFISFDPRGVGLNIPYECPNNITESKSPVDTPMWFDDQYNTNVAQARLCDDASYKASGELIGTGFVARDVKAIAEALGEDGYIRYHGRYLYLAIELQR